ncbi:hypothetical protein BDQ17DRAFT_1433545 [Cyathus striatus]|nr:hypothetical protein BDQ17DRAFT_1433545 [Cyathus striatus]
MGETGVGLTQEEQITVNTPLYTKWQEIGNHTPWSSEMNALIAERPNIKHIGGDAGDNTEGAGDLGNDHEDHNTGHDNIDQGLDDWNVAEPTTSNSEGLADASDSESDELLRNIPHIKPSKLIIESAAPSSVRPSPFPYKTQVPEFMGTCLVLFLS